MPKKRFRSVGHTNSLFPYGGCQAMGDITVNAVAAKMHPHAPGAHEFNTP